MANKVYIIIEMAYEVIWNIMCCSASVPDKLPLWPFIFDMWAGEVDGQQDQTVAQDVYSICGEIKAYLD